MKMMDEEEVKNNMMPSRAVLSLPRPGLKNNIF